MTFLLSVKINGGTAYLQGVRSSALVQRCGYGFTADAAKAWPFPSEAQAAAKARIVARHMAWDADRIKIETL